MYRVELINGRVVELDFQAISKYRRFIHCLVLLEDHGARASLELPSRAGNFLLPAGDVGNSRVEPATVWPGGG